MRVHHKIAFVAACVVCISAVAGSARADRVIDSFTDPFPLQTLPGSSTSSPTLWTGTLGGTQQSQDATMQSSLSGVIRGERYALVTSSYIYNLVTATLSQSSLSYATGTGTSGTLVLEYGVTRDLDANLIADGAVAFELEISGDMDNGGTPRPVQLTVAVSSGSGSGYAQAQVALLADGVYQIPFASFSGVNFADVDSITFTFDASAVSAVDYTLIGGLRTTGCLQAAGSARADMFIDRFQTALPSRYLPGYGTMPFMWVGTFGTATKAIDTAPQTGVTGALGSQRDTTLQVSDISNFITASITKNNATPELSYATGYPTSGHLTLEYGAQSDLNANLSQMTAFELEVQGDLDSGSPRPVPLTVTVASGTGSAATQVTLLSDGIYYIPFSQFPNVNFADVDYIEFYFNASNVQAVDYTLVGGLRASACMP